MPLFFFHLRTPKGVEPDDQGLVLPDVEAAYLEACEAIPPMSAEFMREGVNPLSCSFAITDGTGQALMDVSFAERLRTAWRPPSPREHERVRHLSQEIAEAIDEARETVEQSRAILARSHASW